MFSILKTLAEAKACFELRHVTGNCRLECPRLKGEIEFSGFSLPLCENRS